MDWRSWIFTLIENDVKLEADSVMQLGLLNIAVLLYNG